MPTVTLIPISKWTADEGKVLLLKCVGKDGETHGGFKWPLTVGATVEPETWKPVAECGHGLHGWPWGIGIGDGAEPDYSATWIVFAADPSDVIDLGGKAKCRTATIVTVGTYLECILRVQKGQMAWTQQAARTSGAASNSGTRGAASNSGYSGAASNSGTRGAASNSGYSGAASNSGTSGAASNSGTSGAASNSGTSGAASNSGTSGAASNSGDRGAASNSGDRGAASNSGYRGAIANTGEWATINSSPTGLTACTCDTFLWIIRHGAIVCQRTEKGVWLLVADEWKVEPGQRVLVEHGVIYTHW